MKLASEDQVLEIMELKPSFDESEVRQWSAAKAGAIIGKLHLEDPEYLRTKALNYCDDGFLSEEQINACGDDAPALLALVESVLQAKRVAKEKKLQRKLEKSNAEGDYYGKQLVFSGGFNCAYEGVKVTKKVATDFAQQHGFVVENSVTASINLLVLKDIESTSSKAKAARESGTEIMGDLDFFRMLGVEVDAL